MGAQWSYEDLTSCSPTSGRASFSYLATVSNNRSTPLGPRVSSAPPTRTAPVFIRSRGMVSPSQVKSSERQPIISRSTQSTPVSAPVSPVAFSLAADYPVTNGAPSTPSLQEGDYEEDDISSAGSFPLPSNHCSSPAGARRDGGREGGGSHDSCRKEADALRNEVCRLRRELSKSKDTISTMKDKEKILRHRLSEQARRQLEKGSTKFEDLNLGDNRPTQLIRRYGNLYTEGRLDALDALDELPEVVDFDDLKGKLLLSIVVLAFRNARKNIEQIRQQVRELLHIPEVLGHHDEMSVGIDQSSPASPRRPTPCGNSFSPGSPHRSSGGNNSSVEPIVKELEDVIAVYMRKTVEKHNLAKNYQEVCERVWATLYDFPSLQHCQGLLKYIEECVRLAWALSLQNPPLVVDYEAKTFTPERHTRFHTSDPESDHIKAVLWPVLTDGDTGPCIYKGVVIT